jgi:hypothetical protein
VAWVETTGTRFVKGQIEEQMQGSNGAESHISTHEDKIARDGQTRHHCHSIHAL